MEGLWDHQCFDGRDQTPNPGIVDICIQQPQPPQSWIAGTGSDNTAAPTSGQPHRPRELTMSVTSNASSEATPRYLTGGNPTLADYYPAWLDNLADNVTVEGSMLDGAAQGAENAHAIVVGIRQMYGDSQQFHFVGPWGVNGWLEDYIARVDGKPLGCVVLITRNASGKTQHIVASYRPRSSVVHFARLLALKFAGTPLQKYFLTEAGTS